MKVLALVSDAFGGHGGIALYNRNVLSALCEHPQRPEVVAIPRLVPHALEPLPENLEFRVAARGSKVRFVLEAARAFAAHRRFDVVVASHVNLLPVAEAVRSACGARLVLFVYGIDAWSERDRLTRVLVERVDACVSIRDYTLERMAEWARLDGVRRYVLPNAIHLERYGRGERRADLVARYGLAGKRVLLTLGRLDDPNFGFDEIIEVMPDLVREDPSLVYLVVGGGPHERRLADKARSLGVAEHVVFSGKIDDADKADHYRLADAFAMPGSHPTGFDRYPLRFVFLEAMACGLPVVASRPEELRSDADSPLPNLYVDPTDKADLKAGLMKALSRGPGPVVPELDRYSYPSFRQRLHAIFDEVVG
jgi:glycosyltransferase involved in cell wall biosynthesis